MSAADVELLAKVRRLEDEAEILKTMYTYGHALDYGYEDQFMDCWTEDAYLDWQHVNFKGHEALVKVFREHTHAPDAYHKHLLISPRVTLGGNEASADSMFMRIDAYPNGPEILAFGRYLDRLRRCGDGRWRIFERRAEIESMRKPPEGAYTANAPVS